MFLFKIALRNVFRNPKRSILTVLTLIIGVFGYIFAMGMVRGVEMSFMRADIATDTSHLQVVKRGYLKQEEDFPLDIVLTQPKKLQAEIEKQYPRAIVMPRIVFSTRLSDGVHGLQVRGVAVDADKCKQLFNYAQYGQKKIPLATQKDQNVMIMGKSLAKTFGKKIGDTMTLEARTQAGSINALDFVILDLIETGATRADSFSVFIPMKAGRDLLQMKHDVTGLVIKLPKKELSTAVAAWIEKQHPEVHAETWQERGQTIVQLNQVRRKVFNFIILVIMMIAAAGLANTMLMAGFERKGEIGMMLAMGLPRKRIINMFALEAGCLGFFGSLVGAGIGGWLSYRLSIHGWDISQNAQMIGGNASSISYATTIYWEFSVATLFVGIILGTIVAVLSAIWPAFRITRFEPRDILAGS